VTSVPGEETKTMTSTENNAEQARRIVNAVFRRIPWERQKMWLWIYAEKFMPDPAQGRPTTRRGRVAMRAADRLDVISLWLNRHGWTRKAGPS
jgi:hypothetical protein